MKRFILAFCLSIAASSLHAALLTFDTTTYDTTALARVGAVIDTQSGISPPDAFPLLTSAAVGENSDVDHASAFGSADTGVLGTAAEAASDGKHAAAIGSATFVGSFAASAGKLTLSFVFDEQDVTSGTIDSAGKLTVLLAGNGSTLLSESFVTSGTFERSFDLLSPTQGFLQIVLTSTADSLQGSALNLSSVQFGANFAPVPEPGVYAMLMAGLLSLFVMRRRLM